MAGGLSKSDAFCVYVVLLHINFLFRNKIQRKKREVVMDAGSSIS